jgi:hypothetical protein
MKRKNVKHITNVLSVDLPPIYSYGYSEAFIRWCQGLTLSVLTTFGLVVAVGQQRVHQQPQQETAIMTPSSTTDVKPLVMTTDNLLLNDEWISVWQQRHNGRLLYLLGTVHRSQRSMDTAQQLVESIRPKAVFIELDLNRLDADRLQLPTPIPTAVGIDEQVTKIDAVVVGLETTTTSNSSVETITWLYPRPISLVEELWQRTIYGKQSVVQFDQQTLPCYTSIPSISSSSSSSSSSKNKSSRIKKASEFDCAIWAGQKNGAVIILGDQHKCITLSRLILGGCLDFLNLILFLKLDQELIQRAKEVASHWKPEEHKGKEDHKEQEEEVNGALDYFSSRTREEIKNMSSIFQQIAPRLHRALVAERDDRMAAYLNVLEQYETIVALVGKAHVQGIEERLAKQGWEPVKVVFKEQGFAYWWRW